MGYTHYWYRPKTISPQIFAAIVDDFSKLMPLFNVMCPLKGGLGVGEPELTPEMICFNGDEKCGHPTTGQINIAWPAPVTKNGNAVSAEQAIVGHWFAGALLEQRVCDGDCSHETLSFPRDLTEAFKAHPWKKTQMSGKRKNLYFECCKTAFKPYDLAVTAFLIIAKRYLKEKLLVCSDGKSKDWLDAAHAVHKALGYGYEFKFDEE